MTAIPADNTNKPKIDERTYRRRVRAWVLYDWANSAFATTILAALLPVYFSDVAGATLPSTATATAYWSLTLSLSTFIVAILSPILGTVSDIMRGKKKFLAVFILIGVIGTGLLVLVSTGDWLLAAFFFVFGRIGFAGANVFYDALLPHISTPEDQDSISARGFALGYLGGGILLAVNVAMFFFIPDSVFEFAGIRLSFLSVAIWWAVFSIPILTQVPEPPSATESLEEGQTLLGASFKRVGETFREVRQYRELFKYLLAFLIFIEPVNTIIGLAAIYGAELGFGTIELILALLLVQFVGVPFTLIYGRIPDSKATRRHNYLAYVIFNIVVLPIVAIIAAYTLPIDITGQQPPPYETTGEFSGEGVYGNDGITFDDAWETRTVTGAEQAGEGFLASLAGTPENTEYTEADTADAGFDFAMNGKSLVLTYQLRPDGGLLAVLVDGEPLTTSETVDDETVATPVIIDTYNETVRYNVTETITLEEAGQVTFTLSNVGEANVESTGNMTAISQIEVLPPVRENSLPLIIGGLFALQAIGVIFAIFFGRFFKGIAATLTTRRGILLAIFIYGVVAAWGFVLNSTVEFWFLAWLVATSQGGIQALSRSLYATLSPSSKSGEFFGLFSILSKGASVFGTSLFAAAALLFGSSRPAILSLVVLLAIGGFLLTRVDIEAGKRLAEAEDAEVYGTSS